MAKLIINLYSGMCHLNPEVEISEEDTTTLKQKISELIIPTDNIRHWMGPDQLIVYLGDNTSLFVNGGKVAIHRATPPLVEEFEDSVGITVLLSKYAAEAMAKHAEHMTELYNESVSRTSK